MSPDITVVFQGGKESVTIGSHFELMEVYFKDKSEGYSYLTYLTQSDVDELIKALKKTRKLLL